MTTTIASSSLRGAPMQVLPSPATSHPRTASWAPQFEAVANYVAQHGEYPSHRTALGRWCHLQRHQYKAGRLSTARIVALEALEGWRWSIHDALWEDHFVRVAEHIALTGAYPNAKTGLGNWVKRQRASQRSGDLTASRTAKLETLPGWSWRLRVHIQSWESRLAALADHIPSADGYPSGRDPLARWVLLQRRAHREGTLSSDRVASLEALPGWRWSIASPVPYRLRGPAQQAADALLAHTALKRHRPSCLTEVTYRQYLDVLAVRMSDTSASLAQLAASMSPPMTKDAYAAKLRRAHGLTGVPGTRAERGA